MKHNFFLLLILLFVYTFASAQQPIVIVTDEFGNAPEMAIFVGILDSTKTKAFTAGRNDKNGVVTFDRKIPSGKHPTGLIEVRTGIQYMKESVDYDTDTVRLVFGDEKVKVPKEKEVQLNEVTVSAVRQMVKSDAKGLSMDLTIIPQAKTWTLEDALRQIPGIEFGSRGITYEGQTLTFKENGFYSPNIQQNLSSYLQMPASNFTNLQVLLMDLSLQQSGPSINLMRAKTSDGDVWGNAQGSTSLYNEAIRGLVGAKKGKSLLEFAPNFTWNSPPEYNSTSSTYYTASDRKINGSANNSTPMQTGSGNLHYNFGATKHLFDMNVMLSGGNVKSAMTSNSEELIHNVLTNTYQTQSKSKSTRKNISLSTGYIWNIDKMSTFNMSFQGNIPSFEHNGDTRSSGESSLNYNQGRQTDDQNYYSLISYNRKTRQYGEIETGIKYFYRNQHAQNDFRGYDMIPVGDSIRHSEYENTYNYGAAFASWAKSIRNYSFNFVLTADYSIDNIPTHKDATYRYFTLFPYMAVFRNFNGNQVRFTASYRETRPTITALNPLIDPTMTPDGLIVIEGNPRLKPSKNTRLSLNYSGMWFKKLSASIGLNYNYIWDGIQSVSFARDTVRVRKSENLNSGNVVGLNVGFRYSITERLYTDLQLNFSPKSVQVGQQSPMNWYISHSERLNLSYTLIPKQLAIFANASYSAYSSYQSEQSGVWTTGIGASLNIKDKWAISLSLSNPVQPTITQRNEYDAIGYTTINETTQKQFDANLSIQYRFGKSKSAKRAKSIEIDDM